MHQITWKTFKSSIIRVLRAAKTADISWGGFKLEFIFTTELCWWVLLTELSGVKLWTWRSSKPEMRCQMLPNHTRCWPSTSSTWPRNIRKQRTLIGYIADFRNFLAFNVCMNPGQIPIPCRVILHFLFTSRTAAESYVTLRCCCYDVSLNFVRIDWIVEKLIIPWVHYIK